MIHRNCVLTCELNWTSPGLDPVTCSMNINDPSYSLKAGTS